jgi:hypothetical protein
MGGTIMKYAISRHINGISLNGKEYCLDGEDNVLLFDSFESAKEYLLMHLVDCDEEDLNEDIENDTIQIEPYN